MTKEQDKITVNHIWYKGLKSRIYKNSFNSKDSPVRKWTEDLYKHFSWDNKWLRHTRRRSISLVTKLMEIKTTLRSYFTHKDDQKSWQKCLHGLAYTKNHWIVHFKCVNFRVFESCLKIDAFSDVNFFPIMGYKIDSKHLHSERNQFVSLSHRHLNLIYSHLISY